MGFLDHSTNNVIVDAVLTDRGRQLLARNDGSFQITRFAFGDDEVDYGIIRKFGRTVGKEKIEKNTPIFEAQTNADLGLKYRQMSVANPFLTTLPILSWASTATDYTLTRTSSGGGTTSDTVTITQTTSLETAIDIDLRDSSFLVEYDSRFLNISATSSSANVSTATTGQNFISMVRVRQTGTAADGSQGSIATFKVAPVSFSDDYYNYYATSPSSNVIVTFVTVTGVASGASVTTQYNINKTS